MEKDNARALKCIDIAKTRDYDFEELLKYELSNHLRCLTTEKASDFKSRLERAIADHLEEPTIKEVPVNESKAGILFEFLAYARKVPVKTDKVKSWGDFAEHIWNYFSKLSINSQRVDIFYVHIDSSTKGNLYNRLRQFTILIKHSLSQWKVSGIFLRTSINYSHFS